MVSAQESFLKLLRIKRVSLLAVVVFGVRTVVEIFLLISAVSRFFLSEEKFLSVLFLLGGNPFYFEIHSHLQKSCRSRAPVTHSSNFPECERPPRSHGTTGNPGHEHDSLNYRPYLNDSGFPVKSGSGPGSSRGPSLCVIFISL